MSEEIKIRTLRWEFALLAVVIPALAVFCKYSLFAHNLPEFSLTGIGAKALLLIIVFTSGYLFARKHQDEVGIQALFRNMFLLVLFGEAAIAVMDYLCMFQLFPAFVDNFYEANKQWFAEHSHWPQERKQQALQDIINLKYVSFKDILNAYFRSLITSSIFAFIFAFIIRGLHGQNLKMKKFYQNH